MNKKFFDTQKLQSEVKTRIVTNYFKSWSSVLLPSVLESNSNLAYLDLYAGPGRYDDESISTPIKILELAISNPNLSKGLKSIFNDGDPENHMKLKFEIKNLHGINTLKNKPKIYLGEIDISDGTRFINMDMVPTFTFLDPWGYKGLSLDLINGVIKDWGSECILFFNYNRINAAINNPSVYPHMKALFGKRGLDELRMEVKNKEPRERESIICDKFVAAINDIGGEFVLPFHFRNKNEKLTHSLFFVTKKFIGYNIMKDIMLRENNYYINDVPAFTFSLKYASNTLLFSPEEIQLQTESKSHAVLQKLLIKEYKGQELKLKELYREHSVGKPFLMKDYRKVLLDFERCGKIIVQNDIRKRKNSLPENTFIKFV